ncbi:small conductance calcium-activated potassium channel protein 2-like [Octopus sinensis]|uniref:Small conductance calcium-activated potassium channel protein 2-like n=1 Tax=Octopus sinensis TaxID=2607531 RepID=A0A6P7TWT1_9MOLL|nr:small conductance calcium-activated potassium channel protein 2-like [Octopus sinensis]
MPEKASVCLLSMRMYYLKKKQILTNVALLTALTGLGVGIMDQELRFKNYYKPNSSFPMMLSVFLSLSTSILVLLILFYHYYKIKSRLLWDESISFIAYINLKDIFLIFLEVFVCLIHPVQIFDKKFPINAMLSFPDMTVAYFHLNSLLTILMFNRLYLVLRVFKLNSRYYTNFSPHVVGMLGHIDLNSTFIVKSLLYQYPIRMLIVMIATGFLISSWSLRACEISVDEIHGSFANSMWLVAITYMSVGYGDIVPISFCGRTTAVLTGIFGAFCTALLIAVVIPNLRFTKAERNVYEDFLKLENSKKIEEECVNVSKASHQIYEVAYLVILFSVVREF